MRYALVTGSTRGMGKAIADKLEENGYTVFRNGRSKCEDWSHYIQADVSTKEGIDVIVNEMVRRREQLDCLVFNAGATCRKPFRDITYMDWQAVMDANVNMPFLLAQRMYDHIADRGNLLFISSALSIKPHATSIPYGVSKAAVNMLAQCLVKEFAPKQVRVNVVCPGFIDTEWQKEKPAWLRDKIAGKTALNRFGEVEEVAQMCLAVCENTYMNGAIVSVDGGYDMVH